MANKNFKKSAAELFISTADETKADPEAFTVPKGYRLEREFKTARVQLLVRQTTKDGLRRAAAAQGVSMNELVNTILDEYLEKGGY